MLVCYNYKGYIRSYHKKKEILHVNMMLECNLKLLVKCFCLQTPAKTLSHIMHGTILYGVAQGLHMYCYSLGCLWAGAKQRTYVYFQSHDIQWHILYLVLLYGDISFKVTG